MPAPTNRSPQGQQRQQQQAAVVRAPQQQAPGDDPTQRALVAVTREIDNRLSIIEASAAAGIRPERLKLVALTAFTRNPDLLRCEPVSIARAIVEAGQLGLEPTGLLGGAYLVPRAGKATLLVGYKGLVMLAKRSGEVSRVEARVVREHDAFAYAYGLVPRLEHVPSTEADPGNYTYAYAVIHYRDGSSQFDVMSHAEIELIRKRSSAGSSGPWVSDWPEMAKKTVLRRLLKLAPLAVQVAAQLDDLDPEGGEPAPISRAGGQTSVLRRKLQDQIEREWSGAPIEGEARELEPTTQASAVAPPGQATAAEGARPPSEAPAEVVAQQGAGGAPPAPAAQVVAAVCGANWPPLQVGPCVLPKGHQAGAWVDQRGGEHPAQLEHEEAGGTRWTQPREAQA